ncbi:MULTISPECIES: hypothetical protein [unclassified Streptomyces]|uniref:hypothetical protein n=1 Tax=unclassified Streptomyces TaxID=2593676 RepID=UPI00131A163F|nr:MULTISPECIES: hypothetical protein [unclassified Streptomyces]MYQ82062.1 hypothetical protein [Streptomyces sp. SID4923]
MSETARMTGGPLDGQTFELHPVQEQTGAYGVLCGKCTDPGAPAYVRDGHGRWTWQGKPCPTD